MYMVGANLSFNDQQLVSKLYFETWVIDAILYSIYFILHAYCMWITLVLKEVYSLLNITPSSAPDRT